MKIICPKCSSHFRRSEKYAQNIVKFGFFYRRSDRKHVQRFYCRDCQFHFSVATLSDFYLQKKRQINHQVARLLVSEVSLRECHRILKINRKTVSRKLLFMAERAQNKLNLLNEKRNKAKTIQFDDMETFEHTKCKPLSITLAVEEGTRWILGLQVTEMPSNGLLAAKSVKKYGRRKDFRPLGRAVLFDRIKNYTIDKVVIKSDQNPHYVSDVKLNFPQGLHLRYKGRLGCVVGQGELKKGVYDPLFSLNHTCATLRARTSRLIRRTWCTTKKAGYLQMHLLLVALHHNLTLKPPNLSTA